MTKTKWTIRDEARVALRVALRRHAKINAGHVPDLEAAVRIMLEIGEERANVGEALDRYYPTGRGLRRFIAGLRAEVLAEQRTMADGRA